MDDDLPFKVVRSNSDDEIIARPNNLLVGRAAYGTARRMYPKRGGATNSPHRYPSVTDDG